MAKQSIKAQLGEAAIACRVLALYGHEDKTLGHLSWRDPKGRGLWLKCAGKGLAEIETPDDFVLIDFHGKRLAGKAPLHKEWPIHSEIMLARSDINVVGHTHPFYGCLLAATDAPVTGIAHEGCYFNADVPRYLGTSYLIDTEQLGRDLNNAMGAHKVALMKNHGVVFCGATLGEACVLAITLEKACKQEIILASTGLKVVFPDKEEVALKAREIPVPAILNPFWDYYKRQLARYEKGHGPIVIL